MAVVGILKLILRASCAATSLMPRRPTRKRDFTVKAKAGKSNSARWRMAHTQMENQHGLIVDVKTTQSAYRPAYHPAARQCHCRWNRPNGDMRSASGFVSGLSKPSAGAKRWATCAKPSIADYHMLLPSHWWRLPPITLVSLLKIRLHPILWRRPQESAQDSLAIAWKCRQKPNGYKIFSIDPMYLPKYIGSIEPEFVIRRFFQQPAKGC